MDEAEGKTIFLITGKGNETRQKYGCEYLDCKSDTQYVKEYLAEYDKKASIETERWGGVFLQTHRDA